MEVKEIKKVKFSTLGCRLNQYETQAIREQFLQAGFEETREDEEAHIFVLNTCTVTSESDRESRYLIRKFHRMNSKAQIVVTGCYVERNRNEVEALPGVSLTVGNRQKSEIVGLLESCASFGQTEIPLPRHYAPLSISEFEGRTRTYVKIQDGCNHACSFCKVVLVRGPSRSRPFEEVIEEAKRLGDHGYTEVVLTGIQLGAYGYDLEKRQLLSSLLERLSQIPALSRIRLSSIEPTDVTDELIGAMASIPKVCPHLHIPLQSGDDQVLERMNRRYRRGFYSELIRKIYERIDDFVLTTDVMVGFPGETDAQFAHTVDLLNETQAYKLHIFPYSVREETRAARFRDIIDGAEIQKRREVLLLLEEKLKRQVQERFLNRTMDVLVENLKSSAGAVCGHSANYLRVNLETDQVTPGLMVRVRTNRIENQELIGRIVS